MSLATRSDGSVRWAQNTQRAHLTSLNAPFLHVLRQHSVPVIKYLVRGDTLQQAAYLDQIFIPVSKQKEP